MKRPSQDGGRPPAVASPCINICTMEAGVCVGCYRTLDEIGRWPMAGDDDKHLILAAAAQRRGRLDPDSDLVGNCRDV